MKVLILTLILLASGCVTTGVWHSERCTECELKAFTRTTFWEGQSVRPLMQLLEYDACMKE